MGLFDLIVHAYVAGMLLVSLIVVHWALAERKRNKTEHENTNQFVVSSLELKKAVDDVDRANDISDT